jgi:hypothetical protein
MTVAWVHLGALHGLDPFIGEFGCQADASIPAREQGVEMLMSRVHAHDGFDFFFGEFRRGEASMMRFEAQGVSISSLSWERPCVTATS